MFQSKSILIVSISIFLAVFGLSFFGLAVQTEAANCGGGTVCACGDTVIASTTLTGSLSCSSGHGLIVGTSTITIDGGGYTLTGNNAVDSNGIRNVGGYANITIQNFASITNFKRGVNFDTVLGSNATIRNNTINANKDYGIYLASTPSSAVSDNNVSSTTGTGIGIYVYLSTSTVLTSNVVNSNDLYGIDIASSPSSTITSNTANSNIDTGIYLTASPSSTITSNTASSNSAYGIYLTNSGFSAVSGTTAVSDDYGIFIDVSTSTTLTNNSVSSNHTGIYLSSSPSSTLTSNTASSNTYGIYLSSSGSSTLTSNTANSNTNTGIYLTASPSSTLTSNTMTGNRYNLYVTGSSDAEYNVAIGTSNLVESKPVYYLYGTSSQTYDGDVIGNIGMFWCISCANVTLKNATLSASNETGVYLRSALDTTVSSITASNYNNYGIYILNSTSTVLTSNTANSNFNTGFYLTSSPSSTLTSNTASSNAYGIYLSSSGSSTLTSNTANSNTNTGIYLTASPSSSVTSNTANSNSTYGIYLTNSGFSAVSGTTAVSSGYGIYVNVSTSTTLTNNSVSSSTNSGIYLISSPSSTLTSNTANSNAAFGIALRSSGSSTLTSNTISNSFYGFYIYFSKSNTLSSNTVNSSARGFYIYLSTSTVLSNNTADLTSQAIYLYSSPSSTINSNTLTNNAYDLYISNSGNLSFSSNQFLHNSSSSMLAFPEIARTRNVGDTITFNFSMLTPTSTACPTCTATISMFPTETVTSTQSSNTVTGTSTLRRAGVYSLNFVITDSSSNVTKRNYHFFVGATSTVTTRYYYRQVNPIHGQPKAAPDVLFSDAYSLLQAAPTSTETSYCDSWVQVSPDEIPNYPIADLLSTDVYTRYKTDTDGYIGIQRFVSYGGNQSPRNSVLAAADYTLVNNNFTNLDWGMDYLLTWYWPALHLSGTNPYWQSTPSQPSYADFTYTYTTSPAVKTISNENILVLAATSPSSGTSTVNIILENPNSSATSTTLTLAGYNHPFSGYTNTIYSDSSNTFTVSNIAANSSTSLDSVNLSILPSIGSVNITINTWRTSDDYYKQWTETVAYGNITNQYVVGNMSPNTTYIIKIDGGATHYDTSDSAGRVSFSHTHTSYGTRTFEIVAGVKPGGGTLPMEAYWLPEQPQGGFNVIINAGSPITDKRTVTLNLKGGSDTVRMAISQNLDFSGASQEEYRETKEWNICGSNLECEEGTYVIYAKFYNKWGQFSEVVSSSILYQKKKSKQTLEAVKSFTRNLVLGSIGADVKALQGFLNGFFQFKLAEKGFGSPGNETEYFGRLTYGSVVKFQEAYADKILTPLNLRKGTGYFGPSTRKFANGLLVEKVDGKEL